MGKILKSNITIFLSIISSIYMGLAFPAYAQMLTPIADIYIAFITLMVAPLIFLSLMSTMCRIFKGGMEPEFLKRLFQVLMITILIMAIFAIVFGIFYSPGGSMSKDPIISEIIYKSVKENILVLGLDEPLSKIGNFDLQSFFMDIVPKNFFKSLAEGKNLQIVFLGISLGVTLAFFPIHLHKTRDKILESVESAWFLFQSFMKGVVYLVPFGLFALIASSFSKFSVSIFQALSTLYFSIILSFLCLTVVLVVVIKIFSPKGFRETFFILKEPLQIAFSTGSFQVVMPFLMSSLIKDLKFNEEKVNLILPLGAVLGRTGNMVYFIFTSLCIADMYNHVLNFQEYIFIGVASIIASFMGLAGVAGISLLGFILSPIGVPVGAVLVLLIVLDPLIDPFRTVLSTLSHIAISSLLLGKKAKA